MYADFGQRKSRPTSAPPFHFLRWFLQGIKNHNLETADRQTFFITFIKLAGLHRQLPRSAMITGKVEVEKEILASGGCSDVRFGRYMGHPVAVKALRITPTDDLLKLRRVSINDIVSVNYYTD